MKKIKLILSIAAVCILNTSIAQNLKIDSLRQVLKNHEDDTSGVRIYRRLCGTYMEIGDFKEGLVPGRKAVDLASRLNFPKGKAQSLITLGMCNRMMFNIPEAISLTNEALGLFLMINDTDGVVSAHQNLGLMYAVNDNADSSLYHFEKALKSVKKNTNAQVNILLGIGNFYDVKGDYKKALSYQLDALKISEEMNNELLMANCLNNIGTEHLEAENFQLALDYSRKALILYRKLKILPRQAIALTNMANDYHKLNNFKEAVNCHLQAIEIFRATGNKENLCQAFINIGITLADLKEFVKAINYEKQAVELAEELNDSSSIALAYSNLGRAYIFKGDDKQSRSDYLEALQHLQKSYDLSRKLDNPGMQETDLQLLSEASFGIGDHKNAYLFHLKFFNLHDSLLNSEKSKQITEMQTKYETEKKNKQIQLLNKDKQIQSAEIKRQTLIKNSTLGGVGIAGIFSFLLVRSFNRRRKTSFEKQVSEVEMKALRSQMNPHFIFNSLQSIKKYVLENARNDAAEYLSKFSTLMRLILENSRKQEVSLEKDLSALELYMELESLRFQNKFQYAIEVDPQIDKEDTMIAPLLLQPFVENSIIHGISSKENGMIKIKVNKKDNMIHCTVEDNGIGRDQSVQLETGEKKKRESLGMKITHERLSVINQLKKVKTAVNIFDLKDEDNKPGGLRVELLLPFETAF